MFVARGVRDRRASGRSSSRGVRARRAMARRARRRSRSSRSCAATGAATAATSSTSAWRCCSSASPPRRPSSTRATSRCGPGQTATVGGYDVTLRQGRRRGSSRAPGASSGSTSARVLDVTQGRQARRRRCSPTRGYYPVRTRRSRPISAASSTARRRARSAWTPGCARDIWTAVSARPRARCSRSSKQGDAVFRDAAAPSSTRRRLRRPPLGQALARRSCATTSPTRRRRPSALIVSPLVAWIWLGGADRLPRRPDRALARAATARAAASTAGYAARVARELGRA